MNESTRAFDITPTPASVRLDGNGEGEVSFTVTSRRGRVRARVRVEAEAPAEEGWFEVVGDDERTLDLTDAFVVKLRVPAAEAAGDYRFRLRAVSEANPDEDFADSAWVGFRVEPREQPKKPYPWWIVAAAAGVLVIVGLLIWLLTRDSKVEVPEVEGRVLPAAEALIEDRELRVGDVTRRLSTTDPPDLVLGQDPAGGEKVAKGSAVDLVVAVDPVRQALDFSLSVVETYFARDAEAFLEKVRDPLYADGRAVSREEIRAELRRRPFPGGRDFGDRTMEDYLATYDPKILTSDQYFERFPKLLEVFIDGWRPNEDDYLFIGFEVKPGREEFMGDDLLAFMVTEEEGQWHIIMVAD